MTLDLGTFFVRDIIIHPIPQAKKGDKKPESLRLSGRPSPLTTQLQGHFRERIVAALKTKAFPAVYRADLEEGELRSPVPGYILDFFSGGGSNFVELSQGMARHLYERQPGVSPPGMLAVVDATIGTGSTPGRCIGLLKLEMDEAISFQEIEVDGELTQEMELDEVTLNRKAKTFKAALFGRAATLETLTAQVADDQADPLSFGHEVANFFMQDFLGCRHKPTADRATAEWLTKMSKAVDEVDDPEKKFRYHMALNSYVEGPSPDLAVDDFLQTAIDHGDRDEIRNRMKDAAGNLEPVMKEVAQLASALRTTVVEFEDGLVLRGPSEAVERLVEPEDEQTVVKAPVRHMKQRR